MHARRKSVFIILLLAMFLATALAASAAAERKTHSVVLGAARKVPYSKAGDPSGAAAGEDTLKIRALLVDGVLKEWTTGDAHDVTDRSFVVRRVIRLNDALPTDKPQEKPGPNLASHWVWQRGPWLLVDRATGHVTALHLPDYDPGVSQVSWFRDYAAYCGVTATRQEPVCGGGAVSRAQAGAGQEACSLRCREFDRPRVRSARLAA